MQINEKLILKHLEKSKQGIKDELFNILNGTSFCKFTAQNLQYLVDDLKEIEILEDYIKGNKVLALEKEDE